MTAMPRAVFACPGRGAYTAASLGSLPVRHPWVRRADELRAEMALPSLIELDGAGRFDPALHLLPVHAAPLTWLVSLLDLERAAADYRPAAVVGNSLGWYTALTAAGSLDFDEGFRLVQELALLQQEPLPQDGPGGQVIYPRHDPDWQPDPALERAIDAALHDGGEVFPSVDLGGYVVLAGTETGVGRLLADLPPVRLGERMYPLRLARHGPYHTPLVEHVAAAARERLAGLRWRAPEVTLIDGRGARFSPWSTDPGELAAYTLGAQVVSPYRFDTSIRVALREYAPDVLVLPGPSNSLGAIVGQLVVAEGYRGIRSRTDFEAVQSGPEPVVLSMRR